MNSYVQLTRDNTHPTMSTEEILAEYGQYGRNSLSQQSFTRLSKTSLARSTRSGSGTRIPKREQVV